MTQAEFEKRTQELLAQESTQPLAYWYLSFASNRFLGGFITRARGFIHARLALAIYGIKNPGGEVAGWPLPANLVPPAKFHNRLLTKEEVLEMWPDAKSLGEFVDEAEDTTNYN